MYFLSKADVMNVFQLFFFSPIVADLAGKCLIFPVSFNASDMVWELNSGD